MGDEVYLVVGGVVGEVCHVILELLMTVREVVRAEEYAW